MSLIFTYLTSVLQSFMNSYNFCYFVFGRVLGIFHIQGCDLQINSLTSFSSWIPFIYLCISCLSVGDNIFVFLPSPNKS